MDQGEETAWQFGGKRDRVPRQSGRDVVEGFTGGDDQPCYALGMLPGSNLEEARVVSHQSYIVQVQSLQELSLQLPDTPW